MRSQEFVSEIERIGSQDFSGGKDYLYGSTAPKDLTKLPGGSGLLYSIHGSQSEPTIKLWDPSAKAAQRPLLVAKLSLEKPWGFPLQDALQVYTITVDEDYRGMGLAKALYGIVLTIMRRPLLAGHAQTPGGRRNWVSLSQIPGVEMKGYVQIDDYLLNTSPNPRDNYDRTKNKNVEERIDTIMGRLGGQYIGASRGGDHYFAFDVKPNETGKELESAVKQKLFKIYGSNYQLNTGLYAVWTGQ